MVVMMMMVVVVVMIMAVVVVVAVAEVVVVVVVSTYMLDFLAKDISVINVAFNMTNIIRIISLTSNDNIINIVRACY